MVIKVSIKELKEREKEQRRQYILDAAEKLFASKGGYDNVTMKDIADEVGLNKSTLYLYFKNKEALYSHLMLRVMKIVYTVVKDHMESNRTGMEKIETTGNIVLGFIQKHSDMVEQSRSQHPKELDLEYMAENEAAKEIGMISVGLFEITCNTIKAGIADGSIRPDLNPVGAAAILLLIDNSIMNMDPNIKNMIESHGIDYPEFIREISDFKRHMLMNKEEKKE